MLLLALAKLLIMKHFACSDDEQEKNMRFFTDGEVNQYFNRFCKKLFVFLDEVTPLPRGLASENNGPLIALTKSQSFINFLDITVNKALYECLFIVGNTEKMMQYSLKFIQPFTF